MEKNEIFSEDYLKEWDSYFYPNSNVLKNKLDIRDYDELKKVESEYTFRRLVELRENPLPLNFDKKHLIKIHEYLFQDLYDWAGKYRTVYMAKNSSYFAEVDSIDIYLDDAFSLMQEEIKQVNGYHELISFLAKYFVILLNIHPFREGNGRCIKEFLTEYIEVKSVERLGTAYTMEWGNIDGVRLEEAMVLARAFKGPIEQEFMKALVKVEEIDKQRENK